jgi:hypothetical protein
MNYGIENGILREPVQVTMHLPENWTKVLFVRTYGLGLAGGGIYWDVPTETIPVEFRPIGSRFVLKAKMIGKGNLRYRRASISGDLEIEKLPDTEKLLWPLRNKRLE